MKTASAVRAIAAALAVFFMVAAERGLAGQFTLDDFNLNSAEDLLDICTVDEAEVSHAEAQAFCYGYFQGSMHYHRALASGPGFDPIACPSEPVTVRQLVEVFVAYAQANPQHLSEPPIDTTFRAVVDQWPCA